MRIDPNGPAQNMINELATAVARRNEARILTQSFMLACAANHVELTETRMAWHLEVYNARTMAVYRLLWNLCNLGYADRPGKAPVMRYSAKVRCDTRCTHATGSDCTCTCGGINHATFHPGMLARCENPAEALKALKKVNADALKALNADPVGRMLHLFGVRKYQEITRGLAQHRAA